MKMRVSVQGSKAEMAEMLEDLAEGLRYDEKLPMTGTMGINWEIKEDGAPFHRFPMYIPSASGNTSEEE